MWEQMRATIPESGLLKGREERFWQSMYDQELAKTMAGAGGIGLADMMYEQLSRSLRSASKDTADAVGGQPSGFAEAVAPAPLLRAAAPSQAATAAGDVAKPEQQQTPSVLAGLYSEARQPGEAQGPNPDAILPASGATAAQPTAEDATNPAILAVLNELRAAHQAGAADGRQSPGPGNLSLGARPPLPPMQDDKNSRIQQGKSYVSTLAKPVHRPTSGKRTVLPRAASGPRVPSGQPVNRNLPYARQETLQARAQDQLQGMGAVQGTPAAATDKPSAGG
jgi:Rod binding domain-containing protein